MCQTFGIYGVHPSLKILDCPSRSSGRSKGWGPRAKIWQNALELSFRQAWRRSPEKALESGSVEIVGNRDGLCFCVKLQDNWIWTRARKRNQLLCTRGDTLEIFIGQHGQPSYLEFHIAPNGTLLQLRWPDADSVETTRKETDLKQFTFVDNTFRFRVGRRTKGWWVCGLLPFASISGNEPCSRDLGWDLHFARYDYGKDRKSRILSSTAPLRRPFFHRRNEWNHVRLV